MFLPYIYKYFEFCKSLSNIIFVCHDMWCTKSTRRVLKVMKIFWFGFSKNWVVLHDKKHFMCLCWQIGITPRFIPRKSDSHEGFDNSEMIKKLMIYIIVRKLIRWIRFLHVFLWNPSNFIHFYCILKPIFRIVAFNPKDH